MGEGMGGGAAAAAVNAPSIDPAPRMAQRRLGRGGASSLIIEVFLLSASVDGNAYCKPGPDSCGATIPKVVLRSCGARAAELRRRKAHAVSIEKTPQIATSAQNDMSAEPSDTAGRAWSAGHITAKKTKRPAACATMPGTMDFVRYAVTP